MQPEQIQRTVQHLSRVFHGKTRGLPNADKTGKGMARKLYDWQVEFSYIIDSIERGFVYNTAYEISNANKFISKVIADIEEYRNSK